jgi:phage FluMu protein Com
MTGNRITQRLEPTWLHENRYYPYCATWEIRYTGGFARVSVKGGKIDGYELGGLVDADIVDDVPPISVSACPLPENFVTRELLEIDPENENELFAFINLYGLPFHPLRGKPGHSNSDKGIRDTEEMRKLRERAPSQIISHREAREALKVLQSAIWGMVRMLLDEAGDWEQYEVINWGKDNPLDIRATSLKENAKASSHLQSLTEAVCNQVIDMFNDTAVWRKCPQCGMPFKRHRPKKRANTKIRKSSKHADAAFCSQDCKRIYHNHLTRRKREQIDK